MSEDKLKQKIAQLKQKEEEIRTERQRLEARLFELNAKKLKKENIKKNSETAPSI